jgi:hypothetical protein
MVGASGNVVLGMMKIGRCRSTNMIRRSTWPGRKPDTVALRTHMLESATTQMCQVLELVRNDPGPLAVKSMSSSERYGAQPDSGRRAARLLDIYAEATQ